MDNTSTHPAPATAASPARKPWIRPNVRRVGTVGEILQAGSGKLSTVGDPAEPGRVPGPDL